MERLLSREENSVKRKNSRGCFPGPGASPGSHAESGHKTGSGAPGRASLRFMRAPTPPTGVWYSQDLELMVPWGAVGNDEVWAYSKTPAPAHYAGHS